MPKSLEEYTQWLDERKLLWPVAPAPMAPKATPYLKPLAGIRAVTWSVYGTLLTLAEGRLLFLHPDPLCMEVALDKTIHEFNMWNSMSRKPGAPWEYMFYQYKNLVEDRLLAASPQPGEAPEVDAARIWEVLIERLGKKDFSWDESFYGGIDELSEKVAWFFHRALQGAAAAPHALTALQHVREAGCAQGIIADGQCFTLVQLSRALARQETKTSPEESASLTNLFNRNSVFLSFDHGVRQPAPSLFGTCLARLAKAGVEPAEVLHVASNLKAELAPAKKLGMRTALYAGDAASLVATAAEVKDPELRPDRILTNLSQIRQIIRIDA
ncbi:MAG TPA: HAD family hydrolase [Planctomycetaceae bacterium]|jgi:FMN phosphatase YigB (HAD superfamily)